jgi:hypothetical protein
LSIENSIDAMQPEFQEGVTNRLVNGQPGLIRTPHAGVTGDPQPRDPVPAPVQNIKPALVPIRHHAAAASGEHLMLRPGRDPLDPG